MIKTSNKRICPYKSVYFNYFIFRGRLCCGPFLFNFQEACFFLFEQLVLHISSSCPNSVLLPITGFFLVAYSITSRRVALSTAFVDLHILITIGEKGRH